MGIEVNSSNVVCSRCGTAYSRRKGYFPVSYATLYRGIGYMTVCKDCIDEMYEKYLSICGDSKAAVRQMCRKLDLYWNDNVFEIVSRKSTTRTMMTSYIAKINTVSYAGKSYDDTLLSSGDLWTFNSGDERDDAISVQSEEVCEEDEAIEIPEEIVTFWGPGFTPVMYTELEQRRKYWMSRFPNDADIDIGTEALIRQICNLEIAINQDRAAGKPIDKHVNALNTVLGSASLKPTQRKQDDIEAVLGDTPMGVWLYRYENKRPLPEIDEDLKDVNGLRKYIHIWVKGHLAKMLGLKNYYSAMYDEEVSKYTVEKPEYSEAESSDEVLSDILGGIEDEQG